VGGSSFFNMRNLIFYILLFVVSAACSPGSTSSTIPAPTEAVLMLQVDDLSLRLHTLMGWRGYVERDHIILTEHENDSHNATSLTINIWIPDMTVPEGTTVLDALRTVAGRMRTNPHIAITEPLRVSWSDHEAAYYLLNDGHDRMSLIMVIQLPDQMGMVALNISNIHSDMQQLRRLLVQLFEHFTVNDVLLGADVFHHLPDILDLPSLNPGTMMQPSEQP
jgi:hypothetical protein